MIGRYYRPVVSASYAVDYAIWGLDPYGFHLTNIIIHCIACLLLFRIFEVLFWRYKHRHLFGLLAALIFVVHPVHTEAVSWISGRTDSLVTLFFFASFLCYLEFTREYRHDHKTGITEPVEGSRTVYIVLSLFFYILGLLSKEMIITMPVIIFLYDLVYRRKDAEYLKKMIPVYALFVLVTAGYLVLRYVLLKDIPERESYLYFYGKDAWTAFLTMIKTVPVYFRLLFAPFGLLYHYNGVIEDARSFLQLPVILSFVFILLLCFGAYYFYKKDSIVSFSILFFLVTLLPVMNIVPTMNLMAERFLYLVSFSLVLAIAHFVMKGSTKRDKGFLLLGLLMIIMSMSYLTIVRNNAWKDNQSLYSSAIGTEGTVLLVNEGNIYANMKKFDDAARLYKRAIEIRENSLLAHHNLGLVYLLKGNLDSAEMRFKRGIRVDSLAPDGYFQMATVSNMRGKTDDAIFYLEKLQTVAPGYKESDKLLAEMKSGTSDKLSMVPKTPDNQESKEYKKSILQRTSYAKFTEGKYEEALKDLRELFELSDDSTNKAGILNNMAMCYEKLGNTEKEEEMFLASLALQPSSPGSLSGLTAFYKRIKNNEKAIEFLEKLLAVSPENESARRSLDSLRSLKR